MTHTKSDLKYRDSFPPPAQATPGYCIRVSRRAKHVSIRVSHLGEVEVVIPVGFDPKQVPEILEKRQDWIHRTTQRVLTERQSMTPEPEEQCPRHLLLRSLNEDWSVEYRPSSGAALSAQTLAHRRVLISGPIDQVEACRQVLHRWLSQRAKTGLVPWLRQVSQDIELPCNKISVRGQRSLWASCSNQKNISLNYKLLFLPPDLVRYVFIHELCHTIHLNHSEEFWSLVAAKEANYRQLDKEVSKAWRYVPEWVERSLP